MATYMFLLYDDQTWFDDLTKESWDSMASLHGEFAAAVEAAGARVLGGEALDHVSTSTTVRRDWDDPGTAPVVTDGPFIETKEALGGFYLIEARNLDQALDLAAICPSGIIEVRPAFDTATLPA